MNPKQIAHRWGVKLLLTFAALCGVSTGLAIVGSMAGCAQMGIAMPQTFNERLAAGYTTATAGVQGVDALLKAKKITAAEAAQTLAKLDEAKAGLDAARSLRGTNPLAAQDRLSATLMVLQAMQAYLASKGNP